GQMRNRAPAGDSPAPPPADTPAVQGDQSPLPEHASTSSGAGCTLTELGEEAIYTGNLILVNNQILYRFPEEQELVNIYEEKISGYYVRDMEVFLAPAAMEALNRLLAAFLENGGSETINVVAGYRDAEFQQHLFDQSAQRNGEEHAKKYVAQPGGSEHHTGLVVDLSVLKNGVSQDYDGTGEYAWINENCRDYGWVVRYESGKEELTGIWDEPWHFRYVGVPHATEMARQGMCLEEYMEYLRRFPFDGEHLTIQCADGTYEAWYTQGTRAYLPDSGEYKVSGNNVDGIIVTRKVG
ncbi:MAG: M15 family metallopeptidase, partial [Oscillospiraceae bacterium]|nr:M15 family metallopeptidase [Oscillospiraceae bacterium]